MCTFFPNNFWLSGRSSVAFSPKWFVCMKPMRSRCEMRWHCEDFKDSIHFVTFMTSRANCMSTYSKLRHATLACLSVLVSPVASTFESFNLSLVHFSRTPPGLPVNLCPLQNWIVTGPKSAREGRSDIEPVKRPAGVRIKTARTGDAASSEHKELVI